MLAIILALKKLASDISDKLFVSLFFVDEISIGKVQTDRNSYG